MENAILGQNLQVLHFVYHYFAQSMDQLVSHENNGKQPRNTKAYNLEEIVLKNAQC